VRLPFLRNAEVEGKMPQLSKTILILWVAGTALVALNACKTTERAPGFDPRTCMEQVPSKAAGLRITQGPRTERDIAADMHPAYCNGQVLLKRMNDAGRPVCAGTVWFKVAVEYTGEVSSVNIVKSEIGSNEFLKKMADMIMDSDFTPWVRHDEDAEFIYPMVFTRWWQPPAECVAHSKK